MNLSLEGNRYIVTGASKGLGKALTLGLLLEGAMVTACARNAGGLRDAFSNHALYEKRLFTCAADVGKEDEVGQCVDYAARMMGGVDGIINNAGGVEKFGGLFDLNISDWINTFTVNVMGLAHFSKAGREHLTRSPSPRIINIASVTGLQPGIFNPHYSASKAAAINLAKHLANIFAGDGILVNTVVAGTFESPAWERNVQRVSREKNITIEDAASEEGRLAANSIPLGRIGTADDIVPLVIFLASSRSSWITGATFTIDGGKMRCIH